MEKLRTLCDWSRHFDLYLATPPQKKYATRSTSSNLVPHFDEPKKFYHRKLKGQIQSLVARPITPATSVPAIHDPPPMAMPWLTDMFKPLDVTDIQGAPHALPQKFNDWFPIFLGAMLSLQKTIQALFLLPFKTMMQMNMRMWT